MVKKPDLFPDNWIYIHDPAVKVGRVQNFRSWSPEMVPEGMSCLGLEYFCFDGDEMWDAPDAELIALAKREVAQIGLVEPTELVLLPQGRQGTGVQIHGSQVRTCSEVRQNAKGAIADDSANITSASR